MAKKKIDLENVDLDNLSDEELEAKMAELEKQQPVVDPGDKDNPGDELPPKEPEPEPEPESDPELPKEPKKEPEGDDPKDPPEPQDLNIKLKSKIIEKKHDPVSGLKRDLAGERERRRKAEEKTEALEARLAQLEAKVADPKPPAAQPDAPELDDDDVVSAKVFKQTQAQLQDVNDKVDTQQRLMAEKERRDNDKRVRGFEDQARERYSAATVGESFAYDTIISDVVIPMMQRNPAVAEMIKNSENPAETAYRTGLSQIMDLSGVSAKPQGQQPTPAVPSKPAEIKNAPRTLGSAPAGGGESGEVSLENLTDDRLANMTDEQLDALLSKTK